MLMTSSRYRYPGLVIGTGVEDYFDSGYYFGGDTFLHKGLLFQNQLAGEKKIAMSVIRTDLPRLNELRQ